jgi:4-alpha-glucanotransferase
VAAQRTLGMTPDEHGYREIKQRVRAMSNLSYDAPLNEVLVAAHRLLAQAPSAVIAASLSDALAVHERPNMPGTIDQWPNWSIPLPRPLEQIFSDPICHRIAEALARR